MSGQRTQWNEATRVQMPALVHLTRIGFTYFGKITEDKAGTVYDPDTNILIEVFKSQFAKLNPERAGEAEAMLRIIRQELDNDDIGESFYKRLKAVSPVRLIDFEHPENNIFLPDELPDLMDTSEQEQETYSIRKGDILITRTSETADELAMSCVALKDYPGATYSGFVKRLRPKTIGVAYDKFMAFFLRSKYFRKVINNNTIMTLRASFNEDMFSFLTLYLPDYDVQVAVGDLLYNIECKIQNNKRINDNLAA